MQINESAEVRPGVVDIIRVDRAGGRPSVVERHPERWIGARTPEGDVRYCVKSTGQWFDQGGHEVALADVPQWARDLLEKAGGLPKPQTDQGPAVVVSCEICGERMHHTNVADHHLAHYRDLEASVKGPSNFDDQPAPARRRRRTKAEMEAAREQPIRTAFDDPEGNA